MFALSSAEELKAKLAEQQPKGKKALAAVVQATEVVVEPEYDDNNVQTGGRLSREQVLAFLDSCIDDVQKDETRAEIGRSSGGQGREGPPPNHLLMERQRETLDCMKIERSFGQRELSQVPRRFAGDREVLAKMSAFGDSTQAAFVAILRARKPTELRKEGDMPREDVLLFFDACDTLMALKETKDVLEARAKETRQPPSDEVIAMQRGMLETLGWEPNHAVSQLNAVGVNFPDLMPRMQHFARTAQAACQEAVMGRENYRAQMEAQQAVMESRQRLATEVESMSAQEKKAFIKRVKPLQEQHSKVLTGLSSMNDRMLYMRGLSQDEQDELTKLGMLLGVGRPGSGGGGGGCSHGCSHGPGGHSHAHGHGHGHNHGGGGHSHARGEACGHSHGEEEGHSHGHEGHVHEHGEACSHDHSHGKEEAHEHGKKGGGGECDEGCTHDGEHSHGA